MVKTKLTKASIFLTFEKVYIEKLTEDTRLKIIASIWLHHPQ